MRHTVILPGVVAVGFLAASGPGAGSRIFSTQLLAHATPDAAAASPADELAQSHVQSRLQADIAAVRSFRPAYPFWRHIFTIPDGRIIFGSAADGRLLATFPVSGDWARQGVWEDPALAATLADKRLPSALRLRREQVVHLLEPSVGPVVHNATRGLFLLPHAKRYGSFLGQWGAIYERFGVPAEIGLAQAIIESGLNGRARSAARAVGFCQWLPRNWDRLNRLAPTVIEAHNQTTQAPYCAAYLTVLATMYGSFIPALSEHHAGGVNVGRAVINGERLGGADAREQYMLGAQFARDLRSISIQRYRELFRTFGPRSFLYAEMVFGNTLNVVRLTGEMPQSEIFAMRAPRAIPLSEIIRRTGLSADEVKRFNPALDLRVPADANLYLPQYVSEFGPDVSFWHRPATVPYADLLNEFVRMNATVKQWHEASFESILRDFQRRFQETGTEEGTIMATTMAYMIEDLRTSRRSAILEEFGTSGRILRLFEQGVRELAAAASRLTDRADDSATER